MKNLNTTIKDKMVSRYLEKDNISSTDINVLLNRVRLNQKNETRKKLYFSVAASTGLILFGLIISY
jgi:hypothetical protein